MALNWLLDDVIVPFTRQRRRTDCGVACISMILNFHNCVVPYESLCNIVGVDRRRGTNLEEMVTAIETLGFEAEAVRGERDCFFSDYPLPCIALVEFQNGAAHYVVVYERSREKIVIADPAVGIITLKPEQFLDGAKRKWFIARYRWTGILIFVKKPAIISNMRMEQRAINL